MRGRARAAALAGLLGLAGCTVGPDFHRPSLWSPGSWFTGWFGGRGTAAPATLASLPVSERPDPAWWASFDDPELTALVTQVATSNLDVRTATVRLAEARAQRGIAAADEFPTVNGNGSYTREKQSARGVLGLLGGAAGGTPQTQSNGLGGRTSGVPVGGSEAGAISQPFNLWQYGFDASWELDLWGRVRRAVESADAQVEASTEARRGALISAMAEVARDYIQLRGIQEQLRIARENVAAARELQSLTASRERAGLTTGLDVANAAALAASGEAQIPALEQQEAQTMNALALLLGRPPGALAAELRTPRAVPPVPPRVPIGLPSDLARRRPDIRQAEAQLHAATADVGVAEADFFPRITLSGSLALQALQFKNLGNWDARTYGFGPTIVLPIFQGGRLRATLTLRRQQQQEAAIAYQRTVLQAFHDVDNALIAYAAEQRRRARLAVAVTQNREALRLARQRYTQGLADFLTVLDAQRSLLAAEQQYADSTTAVSTNLAQLYKALGGGWESAYPEDEARARAARRL